MKSTGCRQWLSQKKLFSRNITAARPRATTVMGQEVGVWGGGADCKSMAVKIAFLGAWCSWAWNSPISQMDSSLPAALAINSAQLSGGAGVCDKHLDSSGCWLTSITYDVRVFENSVWWWYHTLSLLVIFPRYPNLRLLLQNFSRPCMDHDVLFFNNIACNGVMVHGLS